MRPFKPGSPLPRGPAHYWALMQAAGPRGFLIGELVGQCNSRAYGTLASYVWWAREMGFVVEVAREPARQPGAADAVRYAVVKALRSAPVVRRADYSGLRGRVQAQLWTAMRVLPQFTVREVAAVSSTEEVTVQPVVASKYVKRLHRAGWLTGVVRPLKGAPGTVGPVAGVYRLKPAFNRGPRPPAIIGLLVFDPNAGAFRGGRVDGSEAAA